MNLIKFILFMLAASAALFGAFVGTMRFVGAIINWVTG